MPHPSKRIRYLVLTLFVVAAAMGGILYAIGRPLPRVVLATGVLDGGYHELGKQLQRALKGKLRVELLPTRGSPENIEKLRNGEATFAFLQGGPDMGQDDLVALANLDSEYGHLIVPVDSPIRNSVDLAGKKIALGDPGSGSYALGKALIDLGRFDPGPTIEETAFTVADLEAAFSAGSIDAAFMVFLLRARVVENLLGTGLYRLVPLHDAEVAAWCLPGTFAKDIPHSFYGPNRSIPPQSKGDVETVAVSALLVTRGETRKGLVRSVLETVYSVPFTRDARLLWLTEEKGRQGTGLPLHPDAERWYDRKAPVTSVQVDMASFFLAGLICLVSATHFTIGRWHHRRQERRRLRIVVYFEELLNCATVVERSNNIDELMATLHEMMSTQRRAEKEWLRGDLRTEDMDNLYTLYGVRSRNAFNKIFQIQNRGLAASLLDLEDRLAALETTGAVGESEAEA